MHNFVKMGMLLDQALTLRIYGTQQTAQRRIHHPSLRFKGSSKTPGDEEDALNNFQKVGSARKRFHSKSIIGKLKTLYKVENIM